MVKKSVIMKKIPLNIPNILSLYRLLSFPFLFYMILAGHEKIFSIFFCINLITDLLDGLIARIFKMQTEVGAKIDSIADFSNNINAFIGIFVFKYAEIEPYLFSFLIFLFLFFFSHILSLIKFKRLPSLHLYSWKITAYLSGIFFFLLFTFGINEVYYFVMVIWGILSFLEHIVIQFIIKRMISNAKGLYWVLKDREKNNT
jgi:CDP-diacylglycerol--glycerol-3-phosphate 3-phosphatidyltransferase